jgi:copper chaperone NosL
MGEIMKKSHILSLILCACVCIAIFNWAPLFAGEPNEAGSVAMNPGKTDRCPVCGMFPHKFPKWMAGVVFENGSKYFHCSPKCMLHNLHETPKYQPGQTRENIKHVWITEYYTTKRMDAHDVLFVTGSGLVGPMGLDLIPVKGRDAAEQLKKDYNGESILTLDEISPEEINRARKGRVK